MSITQDTHELPAELIEERTSRLSAELIARRWNVDLLDCWLETAALASVNALHDANSEAVIREAHRTGVPCPNYQRKLGRLVAIVNHAQRMQRLSMSLSAAVKIARAS